MSKAKVLVVEDDPALLEVIAYNLQLTGFHVVTAKDGHEALRQSRLQSPDLVLLDIMLPGIDGHDVCRGIRADSNTRASCPNTSRFASMNARTGASASRAASSTCGPVRSAEVEPIQFGEPVTGSKSTDRPGMRFFSSAVATARGPSCRVASVCRMSMSPSGSVLICSVAGFKAAVVTSEDLFPFETLDGPESGALGGSGRHNANRTNASKRTNASGSAIKLFFMTFGEIPGHLLEARYDRQCKKHGGGVIHRKWLCKPPRDML